MTVYVESGDLYDYRTGDYLRPATEDEERRSMEAAKTDGGAGAIEIVKAPTQSEIDSEPPPAGVSPTRWAAGDRD